MKYAITNTTLVMTDHLIPNAVIIIEDGKIADFGKMGKISTEGLECIDAKGAYTGPGLIDIHTHGAMNEDASDGRGEGLIKMARYYAAGGVTSWCPTTMTLKEPELIGAMVVGHKEVTPPAA